MRLKIKIMIAVILLLVISTGRVVLVPNAKTDMALKQFKGGEYSYAGQELVVIFDSYSPIIVYILFIILFYKDFYKLLKKYLFKGEDRNGK